MTLRKRKGPTPAWWTLLNQAVTLIQREREIIVRDCSSAGRIDYHARRWIREYDRFLKPARAELVKRHRA